MEVLHVGCEQFLEHTKHPDDLAGTQSDSLGNDVFVDEVDRP